MSEKYNIILNGKAVTGKKGQTALELAADHGVHIPTLCHDPRLEPFTSCYLCVVEVEGMRGLQPACSTRISDGMKITTENEKVFKARKTALDLLLSNHYADCLGPCKQTCPAGVDVQGYISLIEKGMHTDAIALIKDTNPFPAVCGRVCVRPCEVACRRNLLDEGTGVGIDYLKRFAADIDLKSPGKFKPELSPDTGKKVCVIGAGPAGMSAAFFLRKEGHQVDVYEAAPMGGGWLRYGIPEYRLPNDIIQNEINNIAELGVNIYYNKRLGDNLSFAELKSKYDAFILGIGSQVGTSIGCDGDDASNVLSGIDFLKTMEVTGRRYDFKGKTVAVIGGGNTAMDCCRSSIRCDAEKVYVIYRRTEREMPANPIEIHESKLEGVEYMFLTAPVRVNKDENGAMKTMTCIKMELGEPDASGRRRPVPVEGSEFDIELDFALAAIGQKTEINFLEDINKNIGNGGELKPNKWGDIDAAKTLQTGISNVFAAGDGVTGPATLIEAVGQAKIAAHSCHQYLMGVPITPIKKEFISKRENFKEQKSEEYADKYGKQMREEMPTLDPAARMNFDEVELGYASEEVAYHETLRCLECGCSEYFTCDLKKYATEYDVDQKKFEGDFKEYSVDFRHPFVEIDNNKCILCSRCVRICSEVVGANALGLINRGFESYVSPAMGDSLQETLCESCGMCISTCPTGAISENVNFKPGPVKLDSFETICNYCSVGCKLTVHHKNGFVMQVTGANGLVNKDGNICKYPKFGYQYINDKNRITKPLLKKNGKFEEISFNEALEILASRIKAVQPDENAFFAGARLTNEEMYLAQKLAKAGAKTKNISSFHYFEENEGFAANSKANTPFEQLADASHIYLFGSDINMENAVVGFMVNNAKAKKNVNVELITTLDNSSMSHKVDDKLKIKDYYYFIKAVNHYLLTKGMENGLFIGDNCDGFEAYKAKLLAENFDELAGNGAYDKESIIRFAESFNNEMNVVLVFSEKNISANGSFELHNLALIIGKLGKTATGLIALKEKNNAHGLFDMGAVSVDGKKNAGLLKSGKVKNVIIFDEDPVGCAIKKEEVTKWFENVDFVAVRDYFLTETAMKADLVLPSTMPFETGGSFTNAQKVIQTFEKELPSVVEFDNVEQVLALLKAFGLNGMKNHHDVMEEIIANLPKESGNAKYVFRYTANDNYSRIFDYGCDSIVRYFEENFSKALKN